MVIHPSPRCAIIPDFPSAIHNWKDRFFFVHYDPPFRINLVWDEPYVKPNKNDEVLIADKEDFDKLLNMEVPY